MKFNNLSALYDYFDDLVVNDSCDDNLFASSYLRGFISLAACEFGDDLQPLTTALADNVTKQLELAKAELVPKDRAIVLEFWQTLSKSFN